MQYWSKSFAIRPVLLSGLEVMFLSSNVQTFQAPRKNHLPLRFSFVALVWLLVGWSASCGKPAKCGMAGNVWVTFPHMWGRAVLSWRGLLGHPGCCQCLPCTRYGDKQPLVLGPPMHRFVTMTASDHLHLSLYHPPIATGLGGRRKNTDWQIGCTDTMCVRNCCTGQSHSLSLRSLGPVVWWVVMTGEYIGCSGWPDFLWHSDLPYVLHDALLNCLFGHWNLLLISSAQSTRTVFVC